MAVSAVQELSQIPFEQMIGGPLRAAVQAQALAAKTTVDFIQAVGFLPEDDNGQDPFFPEQPPPPDPNAGPGARGMTDVNGGRVRNVQFTYRQRDQTGQVNEVNLDVPILTIVPIPFIRIEDLKIEFTAKLNDMVQNSSASAFRINSEISARYGNGFTPVQASLRVGASYATQSKAESRYTREYQIKINVQAVQDDIPRGMARILDILDKAITPPDDGQ
ncbi:MAG TPA: DUF2589 domain-containing protein [Miltoncostaeaceae bacterium]|nr:DUF2589 domain-containing protein [Miltoncostaeaceae bacterium]